MKILWFTWKDLRHPQAGGAERVNEEIAKRLVRDGHTVVLIVGGFEGCLPEEQRDGYSIVRLGGKYTVYWHAYRYYKKHLKGWADLVVDEMNTIPFFCKYYVKERNVLLAYQLCREIWFYQMPFPFSLIGFLVEPVYLWALNDRFVITESESAKRDLMRFGFSADKISIISVGILTTPLDSLDSVEKLPQPTLLSLGSIRPMKRTIDQIKAYELAKAEVPLLKMIIAGNCSGKYGEKVLSLVKNSKYARDIQYVGSVSEAEKIKLMQTCHLIAVTSIKEGWGLIVTEANSQGTPAVAYDVDGLRDSVRNNETGWVVAQIPGALAAQVVEVLKDARLYNDIRKNAWISSQKITFEQAYADFIRAVNISDFLGKDTINA